jgi:hypothetical protein
MKKILNTLLNLTIFSLVACGIFSPFILGAYVLDYYAKASNLFSLFFILGGWGSIVIIHLIIILILLKLMDKECLNKGEIK